MAFRSLENALLLWKSGGQQIDCGKQWLSAAWKMLYFSGKLGGSTDRLCQTVAFRSLGHPLFLGKSGGQQISCAKLWLSEAWKILYFFGKLGVNR